MIDVLLVLESLHNTVLSLSDNYGECAMSSGSTYTGDHDIVHRAFQTQLKDIAATRQNMQSLHTKLQSTRSLLSSIQAVQPAVSHRSVDQGEHKEATLASTGPGESMYDSSTVKVLTVNVLIYLPIVAVCVSFLSNF